MPTPDESAHAYVERLERDMEGLGPDDVIDIYRRALLERMRVNVGLVHENTELKRRLERYEHGSAPPEEPWEPWEPRQGDPGRLSER